MNEARLRDVKHMSHLLNNLHTGTATVSEVNEITPTVLAELRKARVSESTPTSALMVSRDLYSSLFENAFASGLVDLFDAETRSELLDLGLRGVVLGMDVFTAPADKEDWLPKGTLMVASAGIDGIGGVWGVHLREQSVSAVSNTRRLIHVTVGHADWEPTQEDLDNVLALFINGLRNDGVVVTGPYVRATVLNLEGSAGSGSEVLVTVRKIGDDDEDTSVQDF